MSILSALLGGPAERKVVDVSALSWEALLGTGGASKTGVSVGIDTALRVSTVLACCRALGEDLAQLPLKLYRKRARSTVEATDHPVYDLLANGPNDWQTSVEWRSDSMLHATLGLGHFGIVSMTPTREVIEILPVVPEAVTIRQTSTWDVTYEIHTGQGESRIVPLLGRRRVKCQRSQFLDRGFTRQGGGRGSFLLLRGEQVLLVAPAALAQRPHPQRQHVPKDEEPAQQRGLGQPGEAVLGLAVEHLDAPVAPAHRQRGVLLALHQHALDRRLAAVGQLHGQKRGAQPRVDAAGWVHRAHAG